MPSLTIDPMTPADLQAAHTLLQSHNLPLDGFGDHLANALVARDGARIIGVAALELYPPNALLRSVAIDETMRGRGLGQLITAEAIALARRHNVKAVYLLTQTAEGFFPKFGFSAIPRTAVPEAVQRSVEFTSACPSSARVMVLHLEGGALVPPQEPLS